jgi:azurin
VPDDEGIIRLEANDMMKFNTELIEVEGTTIKLELKHVGTMAKQVMGHNVVILTPGTDALGWASAAASGAQATDYVPEGDPAVIASSKLLGGGESDLIEFEVPGPGEYPFVCSFPGHGAIMKGVLVVR